MAKRDIAGFLTGMPSNYAETMMRSGSLAGDVMGGRLKGMLGGGKTVGLSPREEMEKGVRNFNNLDAQGKKDLIGRLQASGETSLAGQLAAQLKAESEGDKQQQQQQSLISFAKERYVDNPEYVKLIEAGVPLKDVESMSKGEKDFVVAGNSIYIPSTGEFKTMPSTKSGKPPIVKNVFSEEKNANVIRFYDPNDPTKILKEELAPKDQARSSVTLLKLINDTNNKAQEQRVKVQKVGALADKLDQAQGKISSGLTSTAKEALDQVFGTQDYESELRTEAQRLRTSNAIKNLPAGPASDKDVALVLSGEPPANANPEYLARYARGIQKLAQYEADYYTNSSSWLDRYGDNRGFSSYLQREQAEETLAGIPPQAIVELESDMSPQALAEFNQVFGVDYLGATEQLKRANQTLSSLKRDL